MRGPNTKVDYRSIVGALDADGFFRFIEPQKADAAKKRAIEGYCDLYGLFGDTHRLCHALYKEIPFEGPWVLNSIGELALFLQHCDVFIKAKHRTKGIAEPIPGKSRILLFKEEFSSEGHFIILGERRWTILEKNEMLDPESMCDILDASPEMGLKPRQAFLVFLNDLFRSLELAERAYHAWGEGFESLYCFVTPRQAEIINTFSPDPLREKVEMW